ncbi:MAG: quinolinate synthase NadA [candidate division Zixibacteria bacterium]
MAPGITTLPDEYRVADENELSVRIQAKKDELAEKLIILTHHYQRLEIVRLGDHVGDSYGLARLAGESTKADLIVFCGVMFMAEAADILSGPDQKVYLPNPDAGCPMADMANADQVYKAWESINHIIGKDKIIPVSYMNSTAELKAFTGKNGGLICTSTNADAAFKWSFDRGDKLFFFPDQHLGRNTAKRFGVPKEKIVLYDRSQPNGGLADDEIRRAKVILWSGNCYVHTKFKPHDIDRLRGTEPDAKVVVHPECTQEVVDKADAVGSTSFIVNYVENADSGSVIAIGTELNLIHRLAINNPDKKIFELSSDTCPICSNMFRTSLADLCFTLENPDKANRVVVDNDIKSDARISLQRMLEV